MVFTSIGLFLVAIIIFIKDYKTESTKWLAAVCFFSGLGALSAVFNATLRPYLETQGASQETLKLIIYISTILSHVCHYITPYVVLMYGLSYANVVNKNKSIIYSILFIPSIICFMRFPMINNSFKTPNELELYYKQLSVWCVPYILAGAFLIIYAYLKEKSYSIKKHKILTVSIVSPFLVYAAFANYALRSFGIDQTWKVYPILFCVQFTGFIYFAYKYGIFGVRLKFHKNMYAFEDVLQLVSDSVLVLDDKLNIIEFNKAFLNNFLTDAKKYNNLNDLMNSSKLSKCKNGLIDLINVSKANTKIIEIIEIIIEHESEKKYFEVQTNPIIIKREYFGIVLLFKDITLYKKNLELFKQNQFELIEKERLLSLNQLIGGIAHNLKTPLMGSAGGIQIIKKNTTKIYEYIQKEDIDIEYVTKLMNEVNDWQNRISEYLIYMSDVITTVKGQVKEFEQIDEDKFFIKELIHKVKLFMNYEFKKFKCTLIEKIDINNDELIKGSINSFVQVLNILLTNAIEASEKNKERIITLGTYKENKQIIFYVKNLGKKIPIKVQNDIFKKMVTTKGNKGTGLGLYISKSIITGRFNGKISFETNDRETTFFIKIPLYEGGVIYE